MGRLSNAARGALQAPPGVVRGVLGGCLVAVRAVTAQLRVGHYPCHHCFLCALGSAGHTFHSWRECTEEAPEQDSRLCMAGTAPWGPVSVTLSPQDWAWDDCPVSLQMRPWCRRMFRATCLLRGPFLTGRTLCSGPKVAIRPMGTSRAMVKPQSDALFPGRSLEHI